MISRVGFLGLAATAIVGVFASAPAAAQGTLSPLPAQGSGKTICPDGWLHRNGMCNPHDRNAKPAYLRKTNDSCAKGYRQSGAFFCIVGEPTYIKASAASVKKAHPLDRCPVGFFTLNCNGELCTSMAANPPSIRLKGEGPCNEGEIDDWGLWCVSNYEQLTRKDAAKGFPDYNGIYQTSYKTTGKTSKPNQADLPEGKEYTPAYFTIFGRVDREGNPIGGGGAAAATGAPADATSAVAATEAATKQCAPKKKKKKGLGGFGKALGAAVGVDIPDEGC